MRTLVFSVLLAVLAGTGFAADKKISALPDGSPGQATDAIPIARAGANYRLPFSAFAASFSGGTITSPILAPAFDNCTTPPYSFTGDTTTGLCSSADGVVHLRSNGVNVFSVTGTAITSTVRVTAPSLQIGDQADPFNVFMGFESGIAIVPASTGKYNFAAGYRAGKALTVGQSNTLIGYRAGMGIIGDSPVAGNGHSNTVLGSNAFATGTGEFNTIIGSGSAGSATTAADTTTLGAGTMLELAGGVFNTAVGYNAMRFQRGQLAANDGTTTGWNTALGYRAGYGVTGTTKSEMNTFLGAKSGDGNTIGSNNVMIGWQAGDSLTTGDGNIIIGNDVDGSSATVALEVNIGNVYRVASTAQALTDAAAAAVSITLPVATNGWVAGELSWTATSLSGADQLVANGARRWWGSDTAGTPVCGINTIGTDGEGHSGGANTLICTWTNVVSTTNCVLSVTCTNNLAGTQAISLYRTVQREKSGVATFSY